MEPTIVEKDQILLLGFSFFGDPFMTSGGWTEENEIGRLWQRFMTYLADHGDRIKHVAAAEIAYELHVYGEEMASMGNYEVFVGVEVETLEDVPIELLAKMLPPATYAVFTFKGEQIASDWPAMIQGWMQRAGYESAYNYGFQRYDQRFKGVDNLAESELDVYTPIKRASGASSDGDM